jgi:septum formation topological specificity factor MinE
MALVESFEALKKAEDAANDRLQLCLLEDAAAHRALAAAQQAVEKQTRKGRNDRAGPSGSK